MQLAFSYWYAKLNFEKPNLSKKSKMGDEFKKKNCNLEKENQKTKKVQAKSKIAGVSILIGTSFLTNSKFMNENLASNKTSLLSSVVIDGNSLNLKREDVFNENFLFSPLTTKSSEVEKEIEEIEDDEYRYSAWKNTQIGLAVGGSALGMWFAYNGLNAWERWMKEQEKKDIEEEIQMTGTYINPGAGNVEASIDPITGKKIQIKSPEKEEPEKKENKNDANPKDQK